MPSEHKRPIPGLLRLAWLFFMQPFKLHQLFRALGIEKDPSLLMLREESHGHSLDL